MMLHNYVPALKYGAKILPSEIIGFNGFSPWTNFWYVDKDNGSDSEVGTSPTKAFATIQAAVTASAAGGSILIKARKTTALSTDPNNYAENIVIPNGTSELTLFGYGTGRVQSGLPQITVGSVTTQALITVRAPGFAMYNIGVNGIGGTGGGVLLDDDGSTKIANGSTILNCHFKNCVGTTATNAATGGAIQWSANGGAWQSLIKGNRFYKNVGDIVLKGTAQTVPQDVVIDSNEFSGPAASTDCNLYLSGGSGMNGVIIENNVFTAFPAIGSGTNVMNISATGCVGSLANNFFAVSGKTYGAAGNNLIPTTLLMAGNFQGVAAGAGATGEIGRT